MNLHVLLGKFKKGEISEKRLLDSLKSKPFEDIGFAKVDLHRRLIKGFPEVIFAQGKSIGQVVHIATILLKHHHNIFITKANRHLYHSVKRRFSSAVYNTTAHAIFIEVEKIKQHAKNILVLSAGTLDEPVAEEAAFTAEIMGNRVERIFDVGVAGLHRLLSYKEKIFRANVIIAVAGMDGAMPSVVSGLSHRPVIAVPTSVGYGSHFNGIAPLLTMLNSCSPGIAVVNIDNGFGAGYLASLINASV